MLEGLGASDFSLKTLFLVGFGCVCTTMFLFVKVFLCPFMAIIVRSVQYNGGLLPDIILLTQCYYRWGTRLNAMKMFKLVFAAYDPTY